MVQVSSSIEAITHGSVMFSCEKKAQSSYCRKGLIRSGFGLVSIIEPSNWPLILNANISWYPVSLSEHLMEPWCWWWWWQWRSWVNEQITTSAGERVRRPLTWLNCCSAPSVLYYVVWCFFPLSNLRWPLSLTPQTFLWLGRRVQSSQSDALVAHPPLLPTAAPPCCRQRWID